MNYRSKWKWDVVKHLKRCGGGGAKEVLDVTMQKKKSVVKQLVVDESTPKPTTTSESNDSLGYKLLSPESSEKPKAAVSREVLSKGPPNVTVFSNERPPFVYQEGNITGEADEGFQAHDLSGETSSNIVSQSIHPCEQCPFVGHSPAELKRHLRVHSDEKPYSCKTCCYSTKWKCDLKKHLRTYTHDSAVPLTYGGHGRRPTDWITSGADSEPSCGVGDEEMEQEDRDCVLPEENNFGGITAEGRLKCKRCNFEAITITSFLKHKWVHMASSDDEVLRSQQTASQRMPHRRKSFKQSRVPQVESMELVDSTDSSTSEEGKFGKRFWDSLGLQKKTSEEPCAKKRKLVDTNVGPDGAPVDHQNSKYAKTDFNKASEMLDSETDTEVDYTCGSGSRGNLIAASIPDLPKSCSPLKITISHNRILPNPAAFKRLRQRVTTTESEDAVGMSKRKRKLRSCEKCGYVTDNLTTLQRHTSKHGGNGRHCCSQCDYSVDRQHILDYHVTIVHNMGAGALYSGKDMNVVESTTPDILATTTYNLPNISTEVSEVANLSVRPDAEVSNAPKVEKVTVRGHEMELVEKNGKMSYRCFKCLFTSSNVTWAIIHARRHGTKRRFSCKFCDYGVDQERLIVSHMTARHGEQFRNGGGKDGIVLKKEDSCIRCGFTSGSRASMARHRLIRPCSRGNHRTRTDNNNDLKCRFCAFRSNDALVSRTHVKHHGVQKKHRCKSCDFSSDVLNVLLHHRSMHRNK